MHKKLKRISEYSRFCFFNYLFSEVVKAFARAAESTLHLLLDVGYLAPVLADVGSWVPLFIGVASCHKDLPVLLSLLESLLLLAVDLTHARVLS